MIRINRTSSCTIRNLAGCLYVAIRKCMNVLVQRMGDNVVRSKFVESSRCNRASIFNPHEKTASADFKFTPKSTKVGITHTHGQILQNPPSTVIMLYKLSSKRIDAQRLALGNPKPSQQPKPPYKKLHYTQQATISVQHPGPSASCPEEGLQVGLLWLLTIPIQGLLLRHRCA